MDEIMAEPDSAVGNTSEARPEDIVASEQPALSRKPTASRAGKRRGKEAKLESESTVRSRGNQGKGKRATTEASKFDLEAQLLDKPAFFYVAFLPSAPGQLVKGSALVISRGPDAARIAALKQSPYTPPGSVDITGIHAELVPTAIPARHDVSLPKPLSEAGRLDDPTLQALMSGSPHIYIYRAPPAKGSLVSRVYFCVAGSVSMASDHFSALMGMYSHEFNPEYIDGPHHLHTFEEHTEPEVFFLT